MNKMEAILIIDMPKRCSDCKFCNVEYKYNKDALSMGSTCFLLGDKYCEEKIGQASKRVWKDCPLKPIPEKEMILHFPEYRENDYAQGWNNCIDEILGEGK